MGNPSIWDFLRKLSLMLCSCFVHDLATRMEIKKLWSEDIVLHTTERFRILCMNRKLIKWPWAGLFEMNIKIEQGSNFVIDNNSCFFFNAYEAQEVSQRSVAR